MKTKWNIKMLISGLLTVFSLVISADLAAQQKEPADLKDFKLVLEKTESGVKMESISGSAWKELAFSLKKDNPQAIDEYGMTDLEKVSPNTDSPIADFLFTITNTDSGIVLKGIEGTAWTDLSFSMPEKGKQAIDQYGMTKLN